MKYNILNFLYTYFLVIAYKSCLQLAVQPSVTVRSLLPVHERGTAYHLTFDHLHHHSTRLRNIWIPTSFNCLSPACRACDYMYIDYVRRCRSSSCRLLLKLSNLHYITLQVRPFYGCSCAICIYKYIITYPLGGVLGDQLPRLFVLWPPLHISETNPASKLKFGTLVGTNWPMILTLNDPRGGLVGLYQFCRC